MIPVKRKFGIWKLLKGDLGRARQKTGYTITKTCFIASGSRKLSLVETYEICSKLSSDKKSLFSLCFPCFPGSRKRKMVVIDERPFLSGVIEGICYAFVEYCCFRHCNVGPNFEEGNGCF